MRLCYIWWQVQDKRVNTCFYLPPWNRASTVTFALQLFDAVFSDLMMAVTGLGARGFHIQRNTEEKALSRRANWNTPWSVPGEGLRVREGRGGGVEKQDGVASVQQLSQVGWSCLTGLIGWLPDQWDTNRRDMSGRTLCRWLHYLWMELDPKENDQWPDETGLHRLQPGA